MKRKTTDLTKEIYKQIKKASGITMSTLERKIGTNPHSLKEHCELLAYLGLIKIEKTKKTTRIILI